MRNKKLSKISTKIGIAFLGIIVAIGAPIGIVYNINSSIKGKNYVVVQNQQIVKVKPLTADEIINKILQGDLSLLDLKVNDFVKIVKASQSDQPSQIKILTEQIAPNIIKEIKKIDIKSFQLFFDIILNKGLSNISKEDISELGNVVKLFVKEKKYVWWLELLIKYMPTILNEGLNPLFTKNSKEFFDNLKPHFVNLVVQNVIIKTQQKVHKKQEAMLKEDLTTIVSKLSVNNNNDFFKKLVPQFVDLAIKRIIEKPQKETKSQKKERQKREINLKTDIILIANKLFRDHNNEFFNKLVPGFVDLAVKKIITKPQRESRSQKKERQKKEDALKSSLLRIVRKFLINGFSSMKEMADDLTNILYQITDKIPESYDHDVTIPLYGTENIKIPIRPIVKSAIYNLINSIAIPSSIRIKNQVDSIWTRIINIEKENDSLIKQISTIETNIANTKNQETSLNANTYKLLKVKFNEFIATNPYDYLMFQLGILNRDVLTDVGKYDKNNEGNRFLNKKWYEDEYKAYWVLARSLWYSYPSQNRNYGNDEKRKWYQKVEENWKYGITSWWGGPAILPAHERLDKTINVAYGQEVLNSLSTKWTIIQKVENQELIKNNPNKELIIPNFLNDISQILEYEHKQNKLLNLQISKVQKEINLENNKVRIKSFKLKQENLESSQAYKYEITHGITREILKNNQFFKGQGFLKLSQGDLSNILYKTKDLLLNIKTYLDVTIDETIVDLQPPSGASWLVKLGFPIAKEFLSGTIKSKINEKIDPLLKKYITPELIEKIRFVDSMRTIKAFDGIINKGIAQTDNASLLFIAFVVKKMANIKLSDQDLLNMIIIVKNGLNALPKTSRVATIHTIIDSIDMSDYIKSILKTFIKK